MVWMLKKTIFREHGEYDESKEQYVSLLERIR